MLKLKLPKLLKLGDQSDTISLLIRFSLDWEIGVLRYWANPIILPEMVKGTLACFKYLTRIERTTSEAQSLDCGTLTISAFPQDCVQEMHHSFVTISFSTMR